MKIIDIDTESKLILKFRYKEKPYSMALVLMAKSSKYIVVPAILEKNQLVDPASLTDKELIYTTKDGVFQFASTRMETAVFMGMRVYYVSSEEDVTKMNRRGAYRVFIGDLVKITIILENGKRKYVEGILKNLSVTGMGIILKQDFEIGSAMRIVYEFEGVSFLLSGQVVRKEKVARYRAFAYGCRFKDPNNSINRIIILKQLRSKKSGLKTEDSSLNNS